jgi:hypothetical protein
MLFKRYKLHFCISEFKHIKWWYIGRRFYVIFYVMVPYFLHLYRLSDFSSYTEDRYKTLQISKLKSDNFKALQKRLKR